MNNKILEVVLKNETKKIHVNNITNYYTSNSIIHDNIIEINEIGGN